MRLRFYLNLHRLIQSHDLHYSHQGPMILASPFHVANNWLRDFINWYGNVEARLVDLVPALPTSLTNSMFDVVESLINLLRKFVWILLSRAIPAAWIWSTLDSLYTVGSVPWPDTSMRLSVQTAWL